jgi:hypothetical protein
MSNWDLASPHPSRRYWLDRQREISEALDGWSIDELMRGERFAPSAAAASPAPTWPAGGPSDPGDRARAARVGRGCAVAANARAFA